MKKVLFISKQFTPDIGGGIRRIEAIYGMLSNNSEIELKVVTNAVSDTKQYPNVQHIPQILLKDSKKNNVGFTSEVARLKIFDKALIAWSLPVLNKILKEDFDIIYATTPVFANVVIGFLYKILKGGKPKLIIEYRDLFSYDPEIKATLSKSIMQRVEAFIWKFTTKVIVTTNGMKNVLSKAVNSNNVLLVRNYISKKDYDTTINLEKYTFGEEYYHIGYVGKLNTGRNPKRIINLLKYNFHEKPIMIHFVGITDNEVEYILRIVSECGYSKERIKFHGIVNRLTSLRYMKSFDSLILLINDKAKIVDGYGIPGKLYDYIALNGNVLCDDETFINLKTDMELECNCNLGEFKFIKVVENYFLENLFEPIVREITR